MNEMKNIEIDRLKGEKTRSIIVEKIQAVTSVKEATGEQYS